MVSTKLILILVVACFILVAQVTSKGTKKNPCGKNGQPLKNVFCGRGPTRQNCKAGYECVIAPNDSYAVCCPTRLQKRTTTTAPSKKTGSCPPPSTLAGICVVKCDDDFSCPGNEKCCGGCPRQCVSPA